MSVIVEVGLVFFKQVFLNATFVRDSWEKRSTVNISVMATHGDLNPNEEYRMNHKRRGLALIFNHERFYWRLGMNSRSGTNADRYNLEKRYPSITPPLIHEASEEDHSDADCFLLVFLSHGENNCVYTFDGMINIQDITAAFRGDNCPSLVGKPKIFIFQVHLNNTDV
uniref:Caspase family p20 domain-containing protein n=1 Tax=Oryzias sinensis TaxID=183150 RepID=A0A8C8DID5_9TELE